MAADTWKPRPKDPFGRDYLLDYIGKPVALRSAPVLGKIVRVEIDQKFYTIEWPDGSESDHEPDELVFLDP